jgi:transcriptional regulator with XRE-family HTH domain
VAPRNLGGGRTYGGCGAAAKRPISRAQSGGCIIGTMEVQRAGAVLRAARRRRRLSQSQLAVIAGVSQQTVSTIECGHSESSTLRLIRQVAAPLGITVDLALRWRGPDLDRLADERHARIVKAVVDRLSSDWQVSVEYTFNHFGDRGSVDVLATNCAAGAILLVEVKSELDGIESLLRPMDVKARVVPTLVAAQTGWRARSVASVLVLPDETSSRRAVDRMASVFDAALPSRTVAVRQWLAKPVGSLHAVWFLAETPNRGAIRNPGGAGRVRNPTDASSHARIGGSGITPRVEITRPCRQSASSTPPERN